MTQIESILPAWRPKSHSRIIIDAADYAYLGFVIFISADAFTYLDLHSLMWMAAYAYAVLRIAMIIPTFISTLRRNWIFLAYPAMCLTSVLWSDVPAETIRFSVQLMMSTFIAIFLGLRFTPRQIFLMLAAVLLFTMLSSLLNLHGALTPAYDHRNNFKGIFLSKNALGHRSVMFVTTAVFGIFLLRGVRLWLRLSLSAGLMATILMISISGSATAVAMSSLLSVAGLLLWIILILSGGWTLALALLAPAIAAVLFTVMGLGIDPVAAILELLGRSPTLTGRTVLWQLALSYIPERPILGFGANAFWNLPDLQSKITLIQSYYGDGVAGFHNVGLEVLVMLGPLGLIIHTITIGTTIKRAVVLARSTGDTLAVWAATLTIGIYGMAQTSPQLHNPHATPWMLVVILGVNLSLQPRQWQSSP